MRTLSAYILFLFCLTSCVEAPYSDNTQRSNIEALWTIMDEHYCFFDYKKEQLGVDWNEVRSRYIPQANESLSQWQLFELMSSMLGELRDGHINLSSSFDYGRNWSWKEDYPTNFSDTLQRRYLSTDYHISNGLYYRILNDNTAYIHCPSFSNGFGAGNLDNIFYYLSPCTGLILDIRNNPGGQITAAETLAARFTNSEILVGYMQHKNGTAHNDFSTAQPQYISPSKGIRWQKPVVVLTNRSVFSAANEFTKYMKGIAKAQRVQTGNSLITIVGDTTGGGAGMPFSAELPNGWGVRFSACPMYDAEGKLTEGGISPDYKISITDEDFDKGKDTIIEFARHFLKQQ